MRGCADSHPAGVVWTAVGPAGTDRSGCPALVAGLGVLRKSYRNVAHLEKQALRAGSVFLQVATGHEIGYEVCHSIWRRMGNYWTTYPHMKKKKWNEIQKAKSQQNRWPPKFYLHCVRIPVKAFLKFSLASSISCSWVAFSFISRRTWLLADCTME